MIDVEKAEEKMVGVAPEWKETSKAEILTGAYVEKELVTVDNIERRQTTTKTHKQSTRPGKTQIYRSKETCKQTCIQIGHEKSHVQTVVSIEDGINK